MGLSDWFTKLFFGKKDSHFFSSDEARLANAQALASAISPVIEGTIKTRDGGQEVHVTGAIGGAAVRVVLDVTFGGCEFEMRTPGGDSFLLMHDDKGAAAYAGEQHDRDAWDDADGDGQKFFVSEHLYFEGDAGDIAQHRRLWDRIPAAVRGDLVLALERDRGSLSAGGDSISFKPWEGFLGRAEAPQLAHQYLDLLARTATALGRSGSP